jgi:uncharacterized membrane protein YgcG
MSRMRKLFASLGLALLLAGPAHAAERILDFFSDVAVQANGDLEVKESIRVRAEGDQIKRGLLRDFPTRYRRPDGSNVEVGFEVLSVRRDGNDEPYQTQPYGNGVRVRIGSADTLLRAGPHQYEIVYRTTRQIGFFADFDELYWNVTGNGWTFPIDRARARITLPAAADILRTSIYTGVAGAREKDARETGRKSGEVSFETTAPLGVGEGLTVAAAWPKGVIQPPSRFAILFDNVRDNIATATALIGFVLLLAYLIFMLRKTRRRSTGTIVPLFEPPEGMSAPAVRYVVRRAYDRPTFVAAMLQLISTRTMRMDKQADGMRYERLKAADDKAAPQDDAALDVTAHLLFGKDAAFDQDGKEGARFDRARDGLEQALTRRYAGRFFQPNTELARRGLMLWFLYLALCMGTAWLQDPVNAIQVYISVPFTVPAIWAVAALYGAGRKNGFNVGVVCFALFFLLPFLAGGLGVALLTTEPFGLGSVSIVGPLLLLPLVIRSYTYLSGYSEEGYAAMDQIAGFKQYLTLAERPRLEALVTPGEQLQVYERCLPYAVALDVGKQWAAAFSGLFAATAALAAVDAMQSLYGGHDMLNDPIRSTDAFAKDVGHNTSSSSDSISSSSSSPGSSSSWSGSSDSSSSGSSDSGSSGGGGGGGGGSGW